MVKGRRINDVSGVLVLFLSWLIVALFTINALYFVLRVSNPVILSDGWYYLEWFLKKTVEHGLAFSDLFIKRDVDDHAAPLFRLLLLINYRYFGLDYVLDAIVGTISAFACCLVYRGIIFSDVHYDQRLLLNLCWITVCALLLSLNSVGVWVWPLVTLENLTQLLILLFIVAVWHAHCTRQYWILAAATLFLGITSDDSALVAVLAAMIAYGLMLLASAEHRNKTNWKVILVVALCITAARVAYAHLTFEFLKHSQHSLALVLPELPARFKDGGWWQWIFTPLVLPVYYENPLDAEHAAAWNVIQGAMALLLLAAHVVFWRRALRVRYDLSAFAAVSSMLLTYGWIAGIIIWRVSLSGNSYLEQPRYVLLYAGHLIALILMWANFLKESRKFSVTLPKLATWLPVGACLLLLYIQVPQSKTAWRQRASEWAYYSAMAHQLQELTTDPANVSDCTVIQPICGAPLATRAALTKFLKENKLNIYSPKVQRWHPYLQRANAGAN